MQYKRVSYELANVHLESQEAFDLFRQGAPRPRVPGTPIVYNVEMRKFDPPHLILNVQITGENDYFLRFGVNLLGLHPSLFPGSQRRNK